MAPPTVTGMSVQFQPLMQTQVVENAQIIEQPQPNFQTQIQHINQQMQAQLQPQIGDNQQKLAPFSVQNTPQPVPFPQQQVLIVMIWIYRFQMWICSVASKCVVVHYYVVHSKLHSQCVSSAYSATESQHMNSAWSLLFNHVYSITSMFVCGVFDIHSISGISGIRSGIRSGIKQQFAANISNQFNGYFTFFALYSQMEEQRMGLKRKRNGEDDQGPPTFMLPPRIGMG